MGSEMCIRDSPIHRLGSSYVQDAHNSGQLWIHKSTGEVRLSEYTLCHAAANTHVNWGYTQLLSTVDTHVNWGTEAVLCMLIAYLAYTHPKVCMLKHTQHTRFRRPCAKYTNLDSGYILQLLTMETLGPINDSARDFLSNLQATIERLA